MKSTTLLASSLILLSQSAVMAGYEEAGVQKQKNNGSFYGSLFGGVAFFQDGRVDVKNNPSGASDFEFDTGSSIGLRVGYDFGALRVEGEFSHSQADISTLDTNPGSVSVNSQYSNNGLMVNALWDFDFKPFVLSAGFGVGAGMVKYDQMANGGFIAVAESEDTVFSGQLILSATYSLNENTALGINYRYLMTSGVSDSGYVTTGNAPSSIDFDGVDASMLELFLTYKF